MPYAENAGVRIHYEMEGSGPPLFLHHWSMATSAGWCYHGYVDELAHDFTVIAHDVRGHGRSDKPDDAAAYSLAHRTGDVIAVLDDADVEKARFYGYSMGGWVGFGLAQSASDRFESIAVGGAHPYEQSMAGMRAMLDLAIEQGVQALIEEIRSADPGFARAHADEWRHADFEAQKAAATDRVSMEEGLPTINASMLILAGTEDALYEQARRAVDAIPYARFERVDGKDHGGAIEATDLVIPLLRSFFLCSQEGRQA